MQKGREKEWMWVISLAGINKPLPSIYISQWQNSDYNSATRIVCLREDKPIKNESFLEVQFTSRT